MLILAYVRFRKSQSKTLKEVSRNFYGIILYFDWLKVINSSKVILFIHHSRKN